MAKTKAVKTDNQGDGHEVDAAFDLQGEATKDEVASSPTDTGDSAKTVSDRIPNDILDRYEVFSYRNAAVILSEARQAEFSDLLTALREFKITKKMIRTAGGNESDIPKLFSRTLRPLHWFETIIQGDLVVKLSWRETVGKTQEKRDKEIVRKRYIDGHKIDYVKDRVAFDLEWNSKDQTFDRDLYAFSTFFQCGAIDVAVLVTRSKSLNAVFRHLGPSLKKNGDVELKPSGTPRTTSEKYGASTTWMGKLLYRMNAGRNGGCPVLVVGITPRCIEDWTAEDQAASDKVEDELARKGSQSPARGKHRAESG